MVRTYGGWTRTRFGTGELRGPQVDRGHDGHLPFARGHTGRVRCLMWSSDVLQSSAKVGGDRG